MNDRELVEVLFTKAGLPASPDELERAAAMVPLLRQISEGLAAVAAACDDSDVVE